MQNKAFSMEDLFAFLNAGVSAFHSTAAAAAILEAEGYRNCPESAAWHLVPGGKYYTTRNGSAILAWRMPKGPLTGWHAAASHSDSPTWRIKTLDGADHGFARAEVEGYGGMLMSTWFDRPLSVAGRLLVRTADGVESRLVHPERALACIPNLCIHFNREANTGLNYNPQVDLQPIFGAEGGSLKDTLAAEAGGKAEDILATDLVLCITEKAQRVGLQGEYFMSGRIDDLECAYATLYGFLQGRGEEAGRGDIWVMFDNEEVGSSSRQGAQGSLMSDVLARIEESLGVTKEQSIRARTNCLLLSADNGHAIHPNHPEKSDQKLPVNMGGGVILKYNARQTYTTSGLTGAAFTAICEKAGVPVQTFANRADVAGGSTLGLFAYYMNSPFNLLFLLLPTRMVPQAAGLIFLLRTGVTAAAFCWYLQRHFAKADPLFAVLGQCYAFCAFCIVYNQNIIWMDVVMLAPLVLWALELAEEILPDVVLTDIKMPFMDGLTLAKLAKKELPELKIVILSGYDDFNYANKIITRFGINII